MDVKQKPSGIWYVEFRGDNGERRRVSTGIKTIRQRTPPPEANVMAREIVLGLHEPQPKAQKASKKDGRITMQDLFDRAEKTIWSPHEAKSQATIRSNLKILGGIIGPEAIETVTYTRLETLVEELKERGYAPATVKRKLDMVSRVLKEATKWTGPDGKPLLAYKPPMPTIRVANLKDRVLSSSEEEALFLAVEKRRQKEPGRQWFRLRALLRFLLDTGARLGEALGITPESLSERQGTTFVTFQRYRTKNDKPRTLPLTEAAVDALGSLKGHLGLVKEHGEETWRFFPMTSGTAWYMFNQLRDDLKAMGFDISDVTLHTLRHTNLTRLAQGGMDLLRLQKWAGHSDPKITQERYTHLQPDDLLAGASILDGSNSSPSTNRTSIGAMPGIEEYTKSSAIRDREGTLTLN